MFSMQIPDEFIPLKKSSSKEITEADPQQCKTDEKNSLELSSDSNSDQKEQNTEQLNQSNIEQNQTKNVQTDQKNSKKQKKGKNQKKQKKKQMSSSNKQQKKQKFYCRFYMQGSCKNATNCKFIHPVNVPANHTDVKKQKEGKNELMGNDKSQQSKGENGEGEMLSKNSRDLYFEKIIDSMKVTCYSCKEKDIPMTLSCGCSTICESCVKAKKPCCEENHHYDNKVYIK